MSLRGSLLVYRCCLVPLLLDYVLRGCFCDSEQVWVEIVLIVFFSMAHTHTHEHRSWLSPRDDLEVRLLLNRGCHSVEILGDGVI